MKLTNARKFRKALKWLEGYLDHSWGGIEHHREWNGEVKAVREEVDPKDHRTFDAKVAKLEKMGLEQFRKWEAFDKEETKYRERLDDVFDKIWEATKVKKQ